MWEWIASGLSWFVDKVVPPAVVAVVFTFLTNLVLESHRARRDILTDQVKTLRDDLMKLWGAGSEYWGKDASEADAVLYNQILILEQDIRHRGTDVSASLEDTLPSHRMKTMLANLLDAFTGGDFGDPTRKADPSRLSRMREAVLSLRAELSTARAASLRKPFKFGH